MPYYVKMRMESGSVAHVANPHNSVEDAMSAACSSLRYGATDVWIEDHDGNKHADFEAIKRHCGMSKNSGRQDTHMRKVKSVFCSHQTQTIFPSI